MTAATTCERGPLRIGEVGGVALQMRYRLRTLLGLMVIVGAVCAWVVPPLTRGPKRFLIESETPGTLVYSGDRFLGETPLWIYESELPRYDAAGQIYSSWSMSPVGFTHWDERRDRATHEFWFRAPGDVAPKFLQYEGPFGEGTRTDGQPHWGGGGGGADWLGREIEYSSYKVHFQKVRLNEGLIVEVRVPAKMPLATTRVPVSIHIQNPTKITWRAVNDPHYVNVCYTVERTMTDISLWIHAQAEATQLDPGEVCVVEGEVERKRLDRRWWVVFADVRYRPAGTPIAEKQQSDSYERCSNGVLIRFAD